MLTVYIDWSQLNDLSVSENNCTSLFESILFESFTNILYALFLVLQESLDSELLIPLTRFGSAEQFSTILLYIEGIQPEFLAINLFCCLIVQILYSETLHFEHLD